MELASLLVIAIVLGSSIKGLHCKSVWFIFGDSLSDPGNNGYLAASLAKADHPWYGIDMGDGKPNGRFTNGRNVVDFMADAMDVPRPPAYLSPSTDADMILQNGASYASAAGGILNGTGAYFVGRFCFPKQLELYVETIKKIEDKIGKNDSDKFFQDATYIISLGSNDFVNNYLEPAYSDSWMYDDNSFMDHIIGAYRDQLKYLYGLGARNMIVIGLGPLGCMPLERALSPNNECDSKANDLAVVFNRATKQMVGELSEQLSGASFLYGDPYDLAYDAISNPAKYGFENTDAPCCSFGSIRPAVVCTQMSDLCTDRTKYMFWDEYHPTDAANGIASNDLIKKLGLVKTTSQPSTSLGHINGDGGQMKIWSQTSKSTEK